MTQGRRHYLDTLTHARSSCSAADRGLASLSKHCRGASAQLLSVCQQFRTGESSAGQDFKSSMVAALKAGKIVPAPRTYRTQWTANYKHLLGDGKLHYEELYDINVLNAALQHAQPMYLNGEQHSFSLDSLHCADQLEQAWEVFIDMLTLCVKGRHTNFWEWKACIMALDMCWADFEETYVRELISFEQKARLPLSEAVALEEALTALEELEADGSAHTKELLAAQHNLASAVAHLNSLANAHGKGRADLNACVLHVAASVIEGRSKGPRPRLSANECADTFLASRIVESFGAVRSYLRSLTGLMETVDPVLSANVPLRECLEAWESNWEIGEKYLLNQGRRDSLRDVVRRMHSLHEASPTFAAICESCDAELFLILPRVVLMVFLLDADRHEEFVKTFLPHHVLRGGHDTAVDCLFTCFRRLQKAVLLNSDGSRSAASANAVAEKVWMVLEGSIVSGVSSLPSMAWDFSSASSSMAADTDNTLREFVHELERWSMELQRSSPQEWNQCSEVLMNCFNLGRP